MHASLRPIAPKLTSTTEPPCGPSLVSVERPWPVSTGSSMNAMTALESGQRIQGGAVLCGGGGSGWVAGKRSKSGERSVDPAHAQVVQCTSGSRRQQRSRAHIEHRAVGAKTTQADDGLQLLDRSLGASHVPDGACTACSMAATAAGG